MDSLKNREIGVDFDGTLAVYDRFRGVDHLGEPVPEMVARVKQALAEGARVRILTARVYPGADYQRALDATRSTILIAEWCQKHLGTLVPVRYEKTPEITEFWDDRAKEVVANHGVFATELLEAAR